jgi:assimilatory nitrate reductase catalytic subunit
MGREAEIPPRHASGMASGAHSSTTRFARIASRTADEPPSGLRTDLTVSAGPVRRLGEEEPRRVPVGGTAENAGVTWERVDAEDGDLRACPSVDRSAMPRLLEKCDTAGFEQKKAG